MSEFRVGLRKVGLWSRILVLSTCGVVAMASPVFAEDGKVGESSKTMPEVLIEAEEEKAPQVAQTMPDEEDGKIFAGKKATVTELEKLPNITTNNYRQALSRTPGLLTSEVANEGFSSFSYRGLGDPHESFNLNILKDGLPIGADIFGYPANYYQPPLESIEKIEFVHGGGSLLYGPQVGGAINYISREPRKDVPFSAETKQVFGERSLYSTYNQVSGTQDGVGYLGFFHHRQSDGFRKENSDYAVNNGDIKLKFDSTSRATWEVGFDAYSADHGDAGGVTLKQGPGLANYDDDRFQSSVKFDRLRIDRYAPTVKLKYDVDADTTVYANTTAAYYKRMSRRQSAGTAEVFGGIYNGTTNNIVTQEFRSFAFDGRVLHDWKLGEEKQTLSVGTFLYTNDSPFKQEQGQTPWSDAGDLQKQFSRQTYNVALYAENKFVFGKLKVTPGARLENIFQNLDEKVNAASPSSLRQQDDYQGVLLPGIGLAYELTKKLEMYANASSGYKPKTYQDSIPLGTGDTISADLHSATSRTFEMGLRGNPTHWLQFDTSTFAIFYDDQFGRVGTNIQNVGNSQTVGFDVASEVGAFSLLDELAGSDLEENLGNLQVFGNASFLNAEFVSGPLDGKTPQYAPNYLIRTGLNYRAFDLAKVAFQGTLVDNHYADDANSDQWQIPSYAVWDLTAETNFWGKQLSLVAGINNIFDKNYYSRVRSNGIDPGLPRNVYGGMIFRF